MEIILFSLLGLLGLAALLLGGMFIVTKTKPELAPKLFGPLVKLFMRSKRVREASEQMAVKEIAKDPEKLEEMVAQVGGRDAARKMDKMMQGRSEKEREEMLSSLMEKAQSGQPLTQQDLAWSGPKSPDQARAQAKKKAKERAKKKAARRQRKRR
jgi:hypothetical protein